LLRPTGAGRAATFHNARCRSAKPAPTHSASAENTSRPQSRPTQMRDDAMMDRTSTDIAPWHIVASDDKRWSRIGVLRLLFERVEAALDTKV